jgi:hypothetical protein
VCSLFFLYFLFYFMYHTSDKNIQILGKSKFFQICQGIGYNKSMGILDNFEAAWDDQFQFESNPIIETNNLGEPIVDSETNK